jgi:hypothetical protein
MMKPKDEAALKSWLRLAPSTFRDRQGFGDRSVAEQRALLEGWVAWLNLTGAAEPATAAFRERLTRLLDAFDQDQKGAVDEAQLEQWLNEWLETAGQVGGPEREQDPTLPHPKQWHSNFPSED